MEKILKDLQGIAEALKAVKKRSDHQSSVLALVEAAIERGKLHQEPAPTATAPKPAAN
jgi:hypothetical protein